jgi:hypothetical protein
MPGTLFIVVLFGLKGQLPDARSPSAKRDGPGDTAHAAPVREPSETDRENAERLDYMKKTAAEYEFVPTSGPAKPLRLRTLGRLRR